MEKEKNTPMKGTALVPSMWMMGTLVGLVLLSGCTGRDSFATQVSSLSSLTSTGFPQLISYQALPDMSDSLLCVSRPATTRLAASLQQDTLLAGAALQASGPAGAAQTASRAPLRMIRDPYAAYSSIAVDMVRDEVVVTDENLFSILVYDRLADTPPQAERTEPKRTIGGPKTNIEFTCGLYLDQKSGDIYAVNNDRPSPLVIFSREARGNVSPHREVHPPHGTFGIAVDEEDQELFLTIQHDSAVVVYAKTAGGEDAPIRLLQGPRTGLADPHGIAVDTQNDLIFVTNYGSVHDVSASAGAWSGRDLPEANWPLDRDFAVPGSGQILPPSITVYSKSASGNTAPLRVIEGPKTQLNWPTGIAVDPERGELFVANDTGHAIVVFNEKASGDVAPIRVLQGPRTGIKNPTGVFLDTRNDELWVANFGNHSATVYELTAEGDTAPLRTIRSAPIGQPSPMIGNPSSLAYDGRREEILVPN